MAFTPIPIISPKYGEAAQTTQYTAVNTRTRIDKFTATNISATNQTVSVNVVPVGDSAGASNLIVKARQIAPNETYTFPELIGKYLAPGWFISTLVSAGTSVVLSADGTEYTN